MSCKNASFTGKGDGFLRRHQVSAAEVVQQMRLICVAKACHCILHVKAGLVHDVLPQELIPHEGGQRLGGYAHGRVKAALQLTAGQCKTGGYLADARAALRPQDVVDGVQDGRIGILRTEDGQQRMLCMEDLPARIAGLSQERSKSYRRTAQNESLKSAVEALQKLKGGADHA